MFKSVEIENLNEGRAYVYAITNMVNGKFYIGGSIRLKFRWGQHLSSLRGNYHYNKCLQEDFNQFGEESFDLQIIEECQHSNVREKEQFSLDCYCKEKLYNLSRSASCGDLTSYHPENEKIREKIGKAVRQRYAEMSEEERKSTHGHVGSRNGMFGKTHSEEARKRMSEANKGRIPPNKGIPMSDKQKKILSELAKTKTGKKNPFFGKTHSDESRKKISKKNKGKIPPNIKKICIEGVEYISASEASRQLKIPLPTISYRTRSKSEKFSGYQYVL